MQTSLCTGRNSERKEEIERNKLCEKKELRRERRRKILRKEK
jgi:hypothetical protein